MTTQSDSSGALPFYLPGLKEIKVVIAEGTGV